MVMPNITLGDKQRKFTRMIHIFLGWLYDNGYEVTFGDAFRDRRVHGEFGIKLGYGHKESFHKKKLAIDLNLFKDGKYLKKTSDHLKPGEFWESIGGTWGGRFKKKDGNHYSYGENRDD